MNCNNSDFTSSGDDISNDDDDVILALGSSGCSLREKAHEHEFGLVKSNLHKAVGWNIVKSDQSMGSLLPFAADTSKLVPESTSSSSSSSSKANETTSVLWSSEAFQSVRCHLVEDMIGHLQSFNSPLEWKAGSPFKVPLVYCDFTASSRPLRSIEEFLFQTCLPFYGNTHTNTSITGSQSVAFVSEARQIIAEACNAKITGKASQDVVLFAYVV
jgi:hypothetical protein